LVTEGKGQEKRAETAVDFPTELKSRLYNGKGRPGGAGGRSAH